MTQRTCPNTVRNSKWDGAEHHERGAWHQLCTTQSPVGLKGGMTGAWLVFLNGCHAGEDVRLALGPTSIGSAWTSEAVLTGPEIGSHHASISVQTVKASIAPAAPVRILKVNGERVSGDTPLVDGDLISFAETHAVLRFAAAFSPGYKPNARPRPELTLVKPAGEAERATTTGWLVAASGARFGQDWRIVRGTNRMGGGVDLEICWPDGGLPPDACTFQSDGQAIKLASFDKSVQVAVNDGPATLNQALQDSDRLTIAGMEFYLKCL